MAASSFERRGRAGGTKNRPPLHNTPAQSHPSISPRFFKPGGKEKSRRQWPTALESSHSTPARMAGQFHLTRPARGLPGDAQKQSRMFPRHDESRFQVLQLNAHFTAESQERHVIDSDRRKAPIRPGGEWYLIRHARCPSMFKAGVDLFQGQACKSRQRYRLYERHFAAVRGSEAVRGLQKNRQRVEQTNRGRQAKAPF